MKLVIRWSEYGNDYHSAYSGNVYVGRVVKVGAAWGISTPLDFDNTWLMTYSSILDAKHALEKMLNDGVSNLEFENEKGVRDENGSVR